MTSFSYHHLSGIFNNLAFMTHCIEISLLKEKAIPKSLLFRLHL